MKFVLKGHNQVAQTSCPPQFGLFFGSIIFICFTVFSVICWLSLQFCTDYKWLKNLNPPPPPLLTKRKKGKPWRSCEVKRTYSRGGGVVVASFSLLVALFSHLLLVFELLQKLVYGSCLSFFLLLWLLLISLRLLKPYHYNTMRKQPKMQNDTVSAWFNDWIHSCFVSWFFLQV